MKKAVPLDVFMKNKDRAEEVDQKLGGVRHIYVMTPLAYEKRCSRCHRMIKSEDEGRGIFRIRVFCSAEECEKPAEQTPLFLGK